MRGWRFIQLVAVACLLLFPNTVHAQNPCSDPAPTLTVNPTTIAATLPDHTTLISGTTEPVVTDYTISYFTPGANPATATPVQGPFVVPKSAWTAVSGSTSCYTSSMPAAITSTGTQLTAAIQAHRAASTAFPTEAFSSWSALSNPFVKASAPALAKPTLTIRQ